VLGFAPFLIHADLALIFLIIKHEVLMHPSLNIVMAQLDFRLGDIPYNRDKIIETSKHCRDNLHADIVVFPELAITAYPPEDLLLRPEFNQRAEKALSYIQKMVHGIHMVIGHPEQTSRGVFNAASVLFNGERLLTYHKYHLPNYSVFDEKRYFTHHRSCKPAVFQVKGIAVSLLICEDLWLPGPYAQTVKAGAELLLVPNASPFHFRKPDERIEALKQRQMEAKGIPIIYVSCVGGQDELVFDGGSMVIDSHGKVCQAAPLFKESLEVVHCIKEEDVLIKPQTIPPSLSTEETLYQALVLGTRDYILKNHFKGAIVGLSGGVDSALTLAIAADAIGPENVLAVLMPSRYTAAISIEDAIQEADALKVKHQIISIEPSFQAFLKSLSPLFSHLPIDTTEENIQARCRGILLMALSNKLGHIVLTTGNKSELAVGYSTLYGDMAGGFAVIKDCVKTMVYRLAHYRNTIHPVIPERVLMRPPSAELAANQTDQDSLPPYDILDQIIAAYIENDRSIEEIITEGIDAAIVKKVVLMIEKNEYKRRQAPPGVRLTKRAFGRDWRYPITSGFQR
jgi:NAD+ synthase (glutamine-hydrolysing)